MSYNGIGLSSVRGTATSGHVQANQGHVRASRLRRQRENNRQTSERKQFHPVSASAREKGNEELQQHDQRRKLENHLLMLREDMEVAGILSEAEIDVRVNKERERLLLQRKEMEDADTARKAQHAEQREAYAAKRLEDANAPKIAASFHGHGRGPERWHQQRQPQNSWERRQGGRDKNNHVNAARKEHENERLRDAFGIRKDRHVEGQAFDQELQKAKKQERQAKLEEEQKAAEMAERKRLKEVAKVEKKVAKEQKKLDALAKRKEKRRRHRSPSSSSSDSSGSYSSRSYSSSSSSDSSLSRVEDSGRSRQRRTRSDSTSTSSSADRRVSSKESKRKNVEKGANVNEHGRASKSSSPSYKRFRGVEDHATVPGDHTRVEKDKDESRPREKERGRSRSSSYTSNSIRSSQHDSRSMSRSPEHARKAKAGGGKENLASNDRVGTPEKSLPPTNRSRDKDRPPRSSSYASNSSQSSRSDSRSRSRSPGHARKGKAGDRKEKLVGNDRLGTHKTSRPEKGGKKRRSRSSSSDSQSSRSSTSRSRSVSKTTNHKKRPEAKPKPRHERSTSVDSFGRVRPVKQKPGRSASPRSFKSSSSGSSRSRSRLYSR